MRRAVAFRMECGQVCRGAGLKACTTYGRRANVDQRFMRKVFFAMALVAATSGAARTTVNAQAQSPLGGVWSLNPALSQAPREIGFDVLDPSVLSGDDRPNAGATPTRGRRGSTRGSGGRVSGYRLESGADVQRMRILVGEVRTPPVRLTIVDTPAAVTLTHELGQSRTLHPTGKQDFIEVENVPIDVTARRDGDRLVVLYHVEQDRDVRWTYSATANPSRLTAEAQLIERGKEGDKATRVYEAGLSSSAPVVAERTAPPPAANQPPAKAEQPAREAFDQKPGAEFAGLKSVGVLVEDLGPEARACGLRQDAIEDAVAKRLVAGGLSVRKNSDEDTYVYVNIITTSLATGTCVSRYDAFLYTHATSKLSYHERPVLVQVSLMHRGGIGASAVAAHGASVLRGLEGYVDVFVTQIRDANK